MVPGGVHEDAVGDAIGQVGDAYADVLGLGGALDGHVEHYAEGFK